MKSRVMIAAGKSILLQGLKAQADLHDWDIVEAPDRKSALDIWGGKDLDLIIIGPFTNDSRDGLKLAKAIRRRDHKIPIILIADKGSEELAIAALRLGITDYIKASSSFKSFMESVERILVKRRIKLPEVDGTDIVGNSSVMREVKSYLKRIAAVDSTVLITGETGTGKELAAELIHRQSTRCKKPFVCINCAALPESLIESEMFGYERGAFTGAVAMKQGKFEQAEGGTVLLDEIADMSPYAQAKLLRTIEGKEISRLGGGKIIPLDVRLIGATNQNLEQLVEQDKFREDLYYRLNVARVHLPPLRDRKEDIPRLVQYAIRKLNQRFGREVEGLTEEAMSCLIDHNWPGNIRELINLLEAAFINLPSRRISFMDLPTAFRKKVQETRGMRPNERDHVLSALFATNWNKSKAARKLQWSRMTLYRKMAKFQILASPESKKADGE